MYLTFLHHWSMWFGGILNVQLAETQTCEALAWECSKNWAYTTVSSYCHLVLRLDTWYMTLNLRQTMRHVIWLARWWWTNTQVIHVADQLLKSETRCIWLSCTIGACDLVVFWTCNLQRHRLAKRWLESAARIGLIPLYQATAILFCGLILDTWHWTWDKPCDMWFGWQDGDEQTHKLSM